jgi:flagellar basal body-associated protein FliL
MTTHTQQAYPPIEIPKRHLPWFTSMLMAFAVLVLAGVVYSFWNMSSAPMPKLDVPAQDAPAQPANPAPATGQR